MVNLTLSADADLIAKARAYAQSRNTTVNQLIRDYLDRLTGRLDPQQAAEEFAELAHNHGGCSDEGFVFDRRDAHVRRAEARGKDVLAVSKVFLDTNLIVYANDTRDAQKQARAIELVTATMREGTGVISTQVMQEYAVVAGGKLRQDPDMILRQLLLLESLEVVQITPALIRRALELQFRYKIDYWDAGILAAAEHARCRVLWSADLKAGQLYATVHVENPLAGPRKKM